MVPKNFGKKISRFTDQLLLVSWGVLFITLGTDGPLSDLLHPAFRVTCLFAGIGMCVLALAMSFIPTSPRLAFTTPAITQRAILFIPLLLVLTTKPVGLSRSAILNRGIGIEPQLLPNSSRKNSHVYRDESGIWQITPLDAWLFSQSEMEREDFSNTRISITGQLLLPAKDYKPTTPIIFRLWVNCCVADATAIAIKLNNFNTNAPSKIEDLSWIKVQGILHFSESPPHTPSITITDWYPVSPPAEKYLFR